MKHLVMFQRKLIKLRVFENDSINFSNFRSILKTVVMMIGELEFEDLFYNDNERHPQLYPITSHAIYFIFIILVTVILMNLLVGLAVSDIQGLQASAGLNRLSRQAELVARLEGLLFSRLLKKGPPKILRFLRREALLRTSQYNLQLSIRPNDPREKSIPSDIMASIYKLVAERRDRNQSIRRKRNNKNLNLFKDSIEEDVHYRRPGIYRDQTLRKRTVSDQAAANDLQAPQTSYNARRPSNELLMINIKNKLKDVDSKIDALTRKVDDLTNCITFLKLDLNKK